MTTQLPFFGRDAELKLLHDTWRIATDPTIRMPQIVTFVAETGVGKSRIIQEFYRQLTVDEVWDPYHYWPDDFQSPSTQLRVNPEFPTDYIPNGPPRFLWLGMRWHNPDERNVTNSLALPTIKEQVLNFSQHVMTFQSRWKRALEELIASGKEIASAKELIKIVAGNLVPFADVAISLFERSASTVLGREGPQPSLPDQLLELFLAWFTRTDSPIILWLDDAQWMDAEAIGFFTQLMRTARTKRWPLLLIATSWPMEWNQFGKDFFLKHETTRAAHLDNATDTELRALLHAAFPQLPNDQVNLLVHKAGGNFLTMVENIQELQTTSRFFMHSDKTQPLSPIGIENIRQWKSNREERIDQRFNKFDEHIRDFLGRASHAGFNTQFLQRVLLRCREIYPDEAFVRDLLERCQTSLAVIIPTTSSLHEFRDRGYFAVAQKHFTKWLAENERTPIHAALIAELTERVQSAFDDGGNLCNPQSHPTSLRASSSKEQYLILDLALTILTPNSQAHVQALVAMVSRNAADNAWDEIRKLVRGTASQRYFDDTDWSMHAGNCISWSSIDALTIAIQDAGASHQASILHHIRLNYRRTQHTTRRTPDTLSELISALSTIGRIYRDNGDLVIALAHFNEALETSRQLVIISESPDNLNSLAVALNDIGIIHHANGSLSEALSSFSESLTIKRQIVNTRGTPQDLRELSVTINSVGRIYRANGDINMAQQALAESLVIARQIVHIRGTSDDLRYLCITINNVGRIHHANSNIASALDSFSESLKVSQQIVNTRGIPEDLRYLCIAMNNVGRMYHANGETTSAFTYFSKSLVFARQLISIRGTPDDLHEISATLNLMSRIHLTLNDIPAAYKALIECLTIKRQLINIRGTPRDLNGLAVALNSIGHVYSINGDYANAISSFSEALVTAQQLVNIRGTTQDLRELVITLTNIGRLHVANNNRIEAYQSFTHACQIAKYIVSIRGMPEDMLGVAIILNDIMHVHIDHHDNTKALACATEALSLAHQACQHAPHIISDTDMSYLERCVKELTARDSI